MSPAGSSVTSGVGVGVGVSVAFGVALGVDVGLGVEVVSFTAGVSAAGCLASMVADFCEVEAALSEPHPARSDRHKSQDTKNIRYFLISVSFLSSLQGIYLLIKYHFMQRLSSRS